MSFVISCKELKRLSNKNTALLVFMFLPLVCFVVTIMFTMTSLFDSLDIVVSVLDNCSELKDTKYILLLSYMMRIYNHLTKCPSALNCELTENKALFGQDLTLFDAIVFDHSHFIVEWSHHRLASQLYVYTSIESPTNFPACEVHNDDFFNLTFTYRLDSDIVWKFFVVRNSSGDIIAPGKHIQWKESKEPISDKIKTMFKGRTKAAAWIVSNCYSLPKNDYLTSLQEYIYSYSLQIDVFGGCTKRKCTGDCNEMLRNNYYFYMAFENSFGEDYITEKVLHGFDNHVVPIVFGGANYSRFLPPGSYIDARKLHPYTLAHIINQAITNPEIYEFYFRWTNLYTIDSDYTNFHPACVLCDALNSKKAKYAPAKKKFRLWWNTLNGMKWCLPIEHLFSWS